MKNKFYVCIRKKEQFKLCIWDNNLVFNKTSGMMRTERNCAEFNSTAYLFHTHTVSSFIYVCLYSIYILKFWNENWEIEDENGEKLKEKIENISNNIIFEETFQQYIPLYNKFQWGYNKSILRWDPDAYTNKVEHHVPHIQNENENIYGNNI